MEGKKKDGPLLTKKEWLDYIDKLISRENVKNSRSGITVWVVLGALSVILIKIIDLMYDLIDLDISSMLNLFCIFSLVLIFIYIAISIVKTQNSPAKEFFPGFVEYKRYMSFARYILTIYLILVCLTTIFSRSPFNQYLYYTLMAFLLAYMLIEFPEYIHREDARIYHIAYFRILILFYKIRILIRIIIIALCVYLIFVGYENIIDISKNMLLISLYSFAFIALIVFLIYTLSGNIELAYLKKVESRIIASDLDNKEIEEIFGNYFVGLYMYQWAKQSVDEIYKDSEGSLKEQDELKAMLNNKSLEGTSDFTDINIDSVQEKIMQTYGKFIKDYAFILNFKLYLLFNGIDKKENKLINLSIKATGILVKNQKSQLTQIKKIKKKQTPKKITP